MPLFCSLTRYGKTRDVLFYRDLFGVILFLFPELFFMNTIFFLKCYIYKHMLFIQTRLKYIFVRFLFQWPPGDVILSKNHNCIVVNNQNWPTARSILIYRKLSMHRFYFFGHIQL